MTETALKNVLGFGFEEMLKKGIEGGWIPHKEFTGVWHYYETQRIFHFGVEGSEVMYQKWPETILQDPKFWKAVGKVEGWEKPVKQWGQKPDETILAPSHTDYHHRFIDELYRLEEEK